MTRGAGPSLSIDVRIPGVGRVHRRAGVYTAREQRALVAMLHELPKRGYRGLVVDVQVGRRTPLELYAHYTGGTLEQLLRPTDDRPFRPLFEAWLDTALVAETTRVTRRDVWAALQPFVGRRALLLRDLPELLTEYRAACERKATPRAFNQGRSAVQAFVRDTVGKRSPLWLAIADVPKLKERKQGRTGLVLREALAIRDALAPDAAACWWAMCCTGMGPKEYWTDGWHVEGDRLRILGAKAAGRVRDVPLVVAPAAPALTRDGFKSALRRLSERRLHEMLEAQLSRTPTTAELAAALTGRGSWRVTPYQARKTFDRWMQEAQIPRARRVQYLGHGTQDVSDKYELYEVEAYLREDAQRLRALLPRQGIQLAS